MRWRAPCGAVSKALRASKDPDVDAFYRVPGMALGMQVRIRTNSLEFELAPNSHELVERSEFEFATSNSNPP